MLPLLPKFSSRGSVWGAVSSPSARFPMIAICAEGDMTDEQVNRIVEHLC
jgi:hypothetical protein